MRRLSNKAAAYLHTLCVELPHRRVGSKGNRIAMDFSAETVSSFDLAAECPEFDCIDWTHDDVHLSVRGAVELDCPHRQRPAGVGRLREAGRACHGSPRPAAGAAAVDLSDAMRK